MPYIPLGSSSLSPPRRPLVLKAEGVFKRDSNWSPYYNPKRMEVRRKDERDGKLLMIIFNVVLLSILPIFFISPRPAFMNDACLAMYIPLLVMMLVLLPLMWYVPTLGIRQEKEIALSSPIVKIKKNTVMISGATVVPSKISFVELIGDHKEVRIHFKDNAVRILVLKYYKRPESLAHALNLAMRHNGVRIKHLSKTPAISHLSDDEIDYEDGAESTEPSPVEIDTLKMEQPVEKVEKSSEGHCSKCGAAIDEDLIECPRCGTSL